jgi:hypothetical protein
LENNFVTIWVNQSTIWVNNVSQLEYSQEAWSRLGLSKYWGKVKTKFKLSISSQENLCYSQFVTIPTCWKHEGHNTEEKSFKNDSYLTSNQTLSPLDCRGELSRVKNNFPSAFAANAVPFGPNSKARAWAQILFRTGAHSKPCGRSFEIPIRTQNSPAEDYNSKFQIWSTRFRTLTHQSQWENTNLSSSRPKRLRSTTWWRRQWGQLHWFCLATVHGRQVRRVVWYLSNRRKP